MKERFEKIMEYAGVSPKRFAEILGIERSNVSHITSGRNNPSLVVVQKILKSFPSISAEWLLFGEGNMLKTNASGSVPPSPTPAADLQNDTNVTAAPQQATVKAAAPQQATIRNAEPQPTTVKAPELQQATAKPIESKTVTPSAPAAAAAAAPTAQEPQRTKVDAPMTNNSAELQNMLANGLIVLDHSTKTFTVYSPSV
jgi:transcriptional regulator with XRE-family HTH domain